MLMDYLALQHLHNKRKLLIMLLLSVFLLSTVFITLVNGKQKRGNQPLPAQFFEAVKGNVFLQSMSTSSSSSSYHEEDDGVEKSLPEKEEEEGNAKHLDNTGLLLRLKTLPFSTADKSSNERDTISTSTAGDTSSDDSVWKTLQLHELWLGKSNWKSAKNPPGGKDSEKRIKDSGIQGEPLHQKHHHIMTLEAAPASIDANDDLYFEWILQCEMRSHVAEWCKDSSTSMCGSEERNVSPRKKKTSQLHESSDKVNNNKEEEGEEKEKLLWCGMRIVDVEDFVEHKESNYHEEKEVNNRDEMEDEDSWDSEDKTSEKTKSSEKRKAANKNSHIVKEEEEEEEWTLQFFTSDGIDAPLLYKSNGVGASSVEVVGIASVETLLSTNTRLSSNQRGGEGKKMSARISISIGSAHTRIPKPVQKLVRAIAEVSSTEIQRRDFSRPDGVIVMIDTLLVEDVPASLRIAAAGLVSGFLHGKDVSSKKNVLTSSFESVWSYVGVGFLEGTYACIHVLGWMAAAYLAKVLLSFYQKFKEGTKIKTA